MTFSFFTTQKKLFLLLVWIVFLSNAIAQNAVDPLLTKDSMAQSHWVDSIMQQMSVKDKISQLFMVAAFSNKDSIHELEIEKLITDYKIGGLIFMQGTPVRQADLTNKYQSKSNIPLLIGFDGEWGLNMRLDSTYRYPWNLTLGAVFNPKQVEQLGKRIGEQCKRIGIHINFAPVVDINTNPLNPIIGNRSYGSDKINVTEKALAFINGMQSQNVLACGKHFPGHGETSQDSHKTLPVVALEQERIYDIELYPYRELFAHKLASVMTAHLNIPSFDNNIPSSISPKIITDLLKEKMQFKGLIITDALNMKGAANFAEPGKLDLKAFLAGNDILLFPENVPNALDSIYKAYDEKVFDLKRLDESVRKVLKSKYWVGLNHYKPIETKNLTKDLNTLEDELLHRELVDNSITLIKNENIFPIVNVEQKIAFVKLGDASSEIFYETLNKYAPVTLIDSTELDKLSAYDIVIVGYHKSNATPWKSFEMQEHELKLLNEIAVLHPIILTVFTSPYSLLKIEDMKPLESIVIAYQNSETAQELVAQKIFGAIKTTGTLPVSLKNDFPYGIGIQAFPIGRLSYGLPEEVGMSSEKLAKIDTMAQDIIDKKMAPGMQILVARNGKVVYQKSFGYYTYEPIHRVANDNLYDLASVTKITSALPMLMYSYELNKFVLDDPLVKLFPQFKGSNKEQLSLRRILSHNAGLKAWIPFYKSTVDSLTKKPKDLYYSTFETNQFNRKVAENLFIKNDYQDLIYSLIKDSEVSNSKVYKYSDLFFIMSKEYVERTYQTGLEKITDSLFYKPMGATSLTYNPLLKFPKDQIAPTEDDHYYRHQLLQGYVHDMGAAMMGGVSGHAGLFGNANDVAKMMYMYMQEGYYGGKQYLKKSTVETFNHRYYENEGNRRGLGFDKPQLDPKIKATCGCVSDSSFGHSGFTGNYTWADPESGLLYVFLSNRVHPGMENNKMIDTNIRTEIQRVIVGAVEE